MTAEQMQRLTFLYLVTRDHLPWGTVKEIVRHQSGQPWHLVIRSVEDHLVTLHGSTHAPDVGDTIAHTWAESRPTADRESFTSPAGLAMARELLAEWQAGVRPCAEQVLVVG